MSDEIKSQPVRSPCVSVCALDKDDICIACHRRGLEIADWGCMSDEEKRAVWALIRRREQGERDV